MKINFMLRLKNKVTLTTLLVAVVSFVYTVSGILGLTVPISESEITNVIMLFINILVMVGIVVDPTTKGIGDSTRAMTYDNPQ